MVSPIDPNEVRLTGENSFIRLAAMEGGTETTRASHWRILRSPGGPGHVLYLTSELTNDEVRIFSDNPDMARWLQEEIESVLHPPFGDQKVPIVDAEFYRSGNGITFSTETVETQSESISLTWYKLGEPFIIRFEPGAMGPHGVYSCLIPASAAQLTVNGATAEGTPQPDAIGEQMSSTACLAWSETWVRPR